MSIGEQLRALTEHVLGPGFFPPVPLHVPPDAYEAERRRIRAVQWLSLGLAAAVAFSLMPVCWLHHLNVEAAPGWARLVLLLALVQAIYIAWMLNVPDWASVWVLMLVFASVSALYAMGAAMALATPLDHPMLLGMGEVRHSALSWCGAVLLVMSLATYFCGRMSTQWRRKIERQLARRRREQFLSPARRWERSVPSPPGRGQGAVRE
jgi:hypothetical protein